MHIFISYAKKDTRALAATLRDQLRASSNMTVWMDESLQPAASWARQIAREIDRCDYLIMLLSPDVNRTEPHSFVLKEIAYAQQLHKPIIVVMAQKTTIPLEVVDIEYIDFSHDSQMGIQRLLEFLQGQIHEIAPTSPTPAAEIVKSIDTAFLNSHFTLPLLEWIDIPAGTVTLDGSLVSFVVEPFKIAKYPVTNEQFEAFIADGGYQEDRYWERLAQRVTIPQKPAFNNPTHPREMVNWWEAIAFTRWLGQRLGCDVTLPTEWEWQWAAIGSNQTMFSYGNTFDKTKCNTSESGLKGTTPVDLYPQGASYFGVIDMTGNVWEWCLNEYQTPEAINIGSSERRTVKGGSWFNPQNLARAAERTEARVGSRFHDRGFRVCYKLPTS